MEIILILAGVVAFGLWYLQDRGKASAKGLGYFWLILVRNTESNDPHELVVQGVVARRYLMHHCHFQDTLAQAYMAATGDNVDRPSDWKTFKYWVSTPKNYAPTENGEAPPVIHVYAQFKMWDEFGMGAPWKVQSIKRGSWEEINSSQV